MAVGTGSKKLVKPFQAVIEAAATQGTTPSSANFSTLGAIPIEKVGFKKTPDVTQERQVGVEDPLSNVPGPNKYPLVTDFYLPNSTYSKRLVNSVNWTTPTDTVAESVTQFYSFQLNAVEYYRIWKGCMVQSGMLKGEIGKAHRGSITWVTTSNAVPTTSTGFTGSPTLVSTFPSAAIWNWKDGGTTPIQLNAVNQDAVSVTVNIGRGTKEDHTFGNADPLWSMPFDREVTINFENLYSTSANETLWQANTEFTFVWTLKTGVSVLTATGCMIDEYFTTDLVANGQESTKETMVIKPKAIVLT